MSGIGSLVCAVAPSQAVLLAGRTLKRAAGGLLAGLGYAVINAALPRSLWTRASALVSAMWGVATLVGPGLIRRRATPSATRSRPGATVGAWTLSRPVG